MGTPDPSRLKKTKKVTEEEEQPKSEETTEQPLLSLDDEPAPTPAKKICTSQRTSWFISSNGYT